MKRWGLIAAIMMGSAALLWHRVARAEDKLLPEALAILDEDPDRLFFVAIATTPNREKAVASAINLAHWDVFPAAHIVFTQAPASAIESWQSQPNIRFIDVIDDLQARTVHRILQLLSRAGLYDDLGTFRLSVLNISIGPPRALVKSGLSAERAIGAALHDIVAGHGIPVIVSIGNDGPEPGFVNPWALAQDVFVVAGTNRDGTAVWDQSSRFTTPLSKETILFAAQAVDTIGPRAGCAPKTDEERADDARADLAKVVGADNVACYEVKSGTSFAAAGVTRSMCLLHQSVSLLGLELSGSSPVNMSWPLDQFIRGYIDSGIDRSHPAFSNRNADDQHRNGPMLVQLEANQKQLLYDELVSRGIDLRMRWSPDTARAFLTRSAKPVPGAAVEEVGAGFVSWGGVMTMLRGLTLAQLVDTLTPPESPFRQQWIDSLGAASSTPVFRAKDLDRIETYCDKADVALELAIYPN